MLNQLNSFIINERFRFQTEDDNKFAITFSEMSLYLQYLYIILDEYSKYSDEFVKNTKELQGTLRDGANAVTPEQNELFTRSREITTHLHFEIESFHLFAKILLDKIAVALEFYFGSTRGLSLVSHDKLEKNIESYVKAKGLKITSELLEDIKSLKLDVSDFRDYQIQHIPPAKRNRITRATMYDSEGNTSLSVSTLYPKDGERQKDSRKLKELISEIEKYIENIINFVKENGGKTSLALEDSNKTELMRKALGI